MVINESSGAAPHYCFTMHCAVYCNTQLQDKSEAGITSSQFSWIFLIIYQRKWRPSSIRLVALSQKT